MRVEGRPGRAAMRAPGRSAHARQGGALITALVLLIAGCASCRVSYQRPAVPLLTTRAASIGRPVDQVWTAAIEGLRRSPFAVTRIDRQRGLIVVTYRGDPERYVDCGSVAVEVSTPWGARRHYAFSGAAARAVYEEDTGTRLVAVERLLQLEGQVSIVIEESSAHYTRASAVARYLVTRTISRDEASQVSTPARTETIAFTSGTYQSFPEPEATALQCAPTGKLEAEVLAAGAVWPPPR